MYKSKGFSIYTLLAIIIVGFFTACQKDAIESTDLISQDTIVDNITHPSISDQVVELEIKVDSTNNTNEAASRNKILVYSNSFYQSSGRWRGFMYDKSAYDNGYTYYAYLRPTSGEANLYAYRRMGDNYTRIRSSTNNGADGTYIKPADLKRLDDSGDFWVWSVTNTNYQIEIYRSSSPVCKFNRDVTGLVCAQIYDPVCGCDGIEYGNDCMAYLAGVTQTTAGPCSGNNCVIPPDTPRPQIHCDNSYDPVCGCDGVNYSNECQASLAVTSWTNGPCGGNGGGNDSNCNSCQSDGGSLTICDNMEGYNTGNISNQSSHWRKWNSNGDDAEVTTYRRYSGTKSMRVRRNSNGSKEDVILQVGSHNSGTHRASWKMYVPSGRSAYFNIQKSATPGVEWGSEVFFFTNGQAMVKVGGYSYYFTYSQNRWIDVEVIISIDQNLQLLSVNGQLVREWSYHYTPNGTNGRRTLGGIDFYAVGDNSYFYIDNVCFEKDYPFYTTQGGRVAPNNITTDKQQSLIKNLELPKTSLQNM